MAEADDDPDPLDLVLPLPSEPAESIGKVIDRIISLNDWLRKFWSSAKGWAPIEAAELLSKSRLDWQVQLSRTLHLWVEPGPAESAEARLILAWANLGSLVEGTMQLVLSVYLNDFREQPPARPIRTGADPSVMMLDALRTYFAQHVWVSTKEWNDWVLHIQQRRNAVHAYRDRELGTFGEFEDDVRGYRRFLEAHDDRLPYPDDLPVPFVP